MQELLIVFPLCLLLAAFITKVAEDVATNSAEHYMSDLDVSY